MEIKSFILGELQTNCYLLIDQSTDQCLIIDPADEANFLSEQILRQNLKPTAIIATHGHFDHILAAYELQMAFSPPSSLENKLGTSARFPPAESAGSNIPFYIHPKDFFLIKNLQNNSSFWTKRKIIERLPINIFSLASQGNALRSWQIQIIETPGHTPGSVCFYFPKDKVLFTGDTLFADGVGRTDLSYSSKKDLFSSLKKFSKLPPETKIYPGHGNYGIKLKVALNPRVV